MQREGDILITLSELSDMTLRDYFASMAMRDVMVDWRKNRKEYDGVFEEDVVCIARDCYQMADAMLIAREE